jgi:hypothetical protein
VSLVLLAICNDPIEAQIICGRLRSEGIDALVFDGGFSASHGGALPVRLMVPEADKSLAERILAAPAAPD